MAPAGVNWPAIHARTAEAKRIVLEAYPEARAFHHGRNTGWQILSGYGPGMKRLSGIYFNDSDGAWDMAARAITEGGAWAI